MKHETYVHDSLRIGVLYDFGDHIDHDPCRGDQIPYRDRRVSASGELFFFASFSLTISTLIADLTAHRPSREPVVGFRCIVPAQLDAPGWLRCLKVEGTFAA